MKVEKRQEVIETTVYIAEDGTEFNDRVDCERYEEAEQFEKAQKRLREMPSFSMEPPGCDYYAYYSWVRLANEKDLAALKLGEFHPDSTAHDYEAPSYPCWVLYHVDDQGDGYISGTLEELWREFVEYHASVLHQIEEKERKL